MGQTSRHGTPGVQAPPEGAPKEGQAGCSLALPSTRVNVIDGTMFGPLPKCVAGGNSWRKEDTVLPGDKVGWSSRGPPRCGRWREGFCQDYVLCQPLLSTQDPPQDTWAPGGQLTRGPRPAPGRDTAGARRGSAAAALWGSRGVIPNPLGFLDTMTASNSHI